MMHLKTYIKIVFAAFVLAFLPISFQFTAELTGVTAAEAAVVSSISVRGNKRMDADTVISYTSIEPGKSFSNFDIDESVKALYGTGLFSDVSIYQSGRTLIIEVDENSTVNKVFFEGNSRIKDPSLQAGVSIKPQSIFNDDQAASDVEQIKLAYARVGREDADVSYEVVPLTNNRVNVVYRIVEGDKTKISKIIFVGNSTFPDRRLADLISTKESNFLSFLTTNDIYDPNRIRADEEKLRRFYFNKGFADFQLISTTADIDPASNEYTITFTIEEGARYTFGEINIESTIDGIDGSRLAAELKTESGEYYSAKAVEDSIIGMTESVAEEGYAFVEIVPRGNRNFDNNTIDVTYLVDEGARVYIESIKIVGNDRTRDYVMRRVFDLSEGDAYNKVLVQRSKRRIEDLGFFDSVNIQTRPGSEPDRIIVVVHVKEKATGEFSISGGYSSSGGAAANVSFTEKNFLGRGQYLKIGMANGEDDVTYSFAFTEPYFLGYRMSAGIALSSTESDDTDERRYNVDTTSGTLTFGIPITERLDSAVFYTFEDSDTRTTLTTLSPALTKDLGSFTKSGAGFGIVYTDFDEPKDPREGFRLSFSNTIYGIGGDANYYSAEVNLANYTLISEETDVVLFSQVKAGYANEFGTNGMRTIDNFSARPNLVRGFDSFGFGPRDPNTGDALGGRMYWAAKAEMQFPLPFVPRSLGLRGAVFADAAQLSDPGDSAIAAVLAANAASDLSQLDDDNVRASVGGSVIWASPFGPLRLDYAVPIAEETYDKTQEFSFGVSSRF